MNELRDVLLHSKNYLSANVATKALAVISLPVLTAMLSPAEYGTYQVFVSYVGILSIILTLNFNGSVARYYFDKPEDFGEFLSTSLIGAATILMVFVVIALVFLGSVSNLLQLSRELVMLLLIAIALRLMFSSFSHVNIAQSKSSKLAKLTVAKSYAAFAIGLSLVFTMSNDRYMGLIYADIGVSALVALYCFISLSRVIKLAFKKSHIKYIVGYSVALLPYILSGVILGQIDRVMINGFFGAREVGLYSVAYNIGSLLTLVVYAMNTAFAPKWFDLKRQGEEVKITQMESSMHVIVLFFASSLVLFSDELFFLLVNSSFHASKHIVAIVVAAYVFESIFKVYGRVIGHTKKMIYMSVIGVFGALVNILLNYIYLPVYGYEVGAVTTLAAFISMLFLAIAIAKYRLHQETIPPVTFFKPMIFFVLIIVLDLLLARANVSYPAIIVSKCLIFIGIAFVFWKLINRSNYIYQVN